MVAVHRCTGALQCNLNRVQRLCAVAVGPPKLRLFHHKLCGSFSVFHRNGQARACTIGRCQRTDSLQRSIGVHHVGGNVSRDAHLAFLVELAQMHVTNFCCVRQAEADAAPDTGVRQIRAPVPAKHIMRLAQICITVLTAGGGIENIALGVLGLNVAQRGSKIDPQCVFRLQLSGDIHPPRAVHIISTQNDLVIQPHGGQCVEPFKHQHSLGGCTLVGCQAEAAPVGVVLVEQLLDLVFIPAPVRILAEIQGQHIAENTARHGARVDGVTVCSRPLPDTVQGNLFVHNGSFWPGIRPSDRRLQCLRQSCAGKSGRR